jgi:hypothetical protein
MVSPRNPDDETCGGILSKDFGFRAAMRGRGSWPAVVAAAWQRSEKGQPKNFGPGRTADRLGE